jgi:hypothetical protein
VRTTIFLLLIAFVLTACGGDDTGSDAGADSDGGTQSVTTTGSDGQADGALDSALGGGGSGTLVFNGTEHPIDSVVCDFGDGVDIGTVGDDFQVLVGGSSAEGFDIQILDPDHSQWVARNDTLEVSGARFFSDGDTYYSNQRQGEIEASFEIQCP